MIIKVAGVVSTLAIMAVLSGAQAQTINSESNANSSSGAVSGSQSGASAVSRGGAGGSATANQGVTANTNTGVTLNQNSTSPATTTSNSNVRYSGGTSNSNYNQQGGYVTGDQIIRAAPTVYAPPVSGGSPCTMGYSAGASFLGWGAAAGGQVIDTACERRMNAAMLYNAGWKGAAKEIACNDREVYYAFRSAGEPCQPRAAWDGVATPVAAPMAAPQPVTVTPAPRPAVMAAPKEYPRCNPARGITDNCRS